MTVYVSDRLTRLQVKIPSLPIPSTQCGSPAASVFLSSSDTPHSHGEQPNSQVSAKHTLDQPCNLTKMRVGDSHNETGLISTSLNETLTPKSEVLTLQTALASQITNELTQETIQSVTDESSSVPCYRCLFPKPPPSSAVEGCSEAGVLGVEVHAGRLFVLDVGRNLTRSIQLRGRRPDCSICPRTVLSYLNQEQHEEIARRRIADTNYTLFCGSADHDRVGFLSLHYICLIHK
ncbi:unnamed protein product [Protopolystoma xenopodis]|uniref:Uncharacterized protein n=1 Tax=Protopolystoma xenopodis TaxID=117903 RepID=A0A448WQ05_9PLAT|nr:unnamed protein product [Protopolystoma xenopodis]